MKQFFIVLSLFTFSAFAQNRETPDYEGWLSNSHNRDCGDVYDRLISVNVRDVSRSHMMEQVYKITGYTPEQINDGSQEITVVFVWARSVASRYGSVTSTGCKIEVLKENL